MRFPFFGLQALSEEKEDLSGTWKLAVPGGATWKLAVPEEDTLIPAEPEKDSKMAGFVQHSNIPAQEEVASQEEEIASQQVRLQ